MEANMSMWSRLQNLDVSLSVTPPKVTSGVQWIFLLFVLFWNAFNVHIETKKDELVRIDIAPVLGKLCKIKT
jgi:hypothetical protein